MEGSLDRALHLGEGGGLTGEWLAAMCLTREGGGQRLVGRATSRGERCPVASTQCGQRFGPPGGLHRLAACGDKAMWARL
jgi:hypothetical protein